MKVVRATGHMNGKWLRRFDHIFLNSDLNSHAIFCRYVGLPCIQHIYRTQPWRPITDDNKEIIFLAK